MAYASSCILRRPGLTLDILKKRKEFLSVSHGRHRHVHSLVLQAKRREEDSSLETIRVGFTCSKKVGNAVARNRAKRRLREAARTVLPEFGHPGWNYVIVGRRRTTATRKFAHLCDDLRLALKAIHSERHVP